MSNQENEARSFFESAEMDTGPSSQRVEALRERLVERRAQPAARGSGRRIGRSIVIGAMLIVAVSSFGFGATETGRKLTTEVIRLVTGQEALVVETESGTKWCNTGVDTEDKEVADSLREYYTDVELIMKAGGGRLVGLLDAINDDGSLRTTLQIEYFEGFGIYGPIGHSRDSLTEKQRERMCIDEVLEIHNAGKGELLSTRPFKRGDGCFYNIRYALENGGSVTVQEWCPPGTVDERKAVLAAEKE